VIAYLKRRQISLTMQHTDPNQSIHSKFADEKSNLEYYRLAARDF